jgi:hypothetical protein
VSSKLHAGQNQNINLGNKSFERVGRVIRRETTLTNQNSIYEKNKRRQFRDSLLSFGVESFFFQFAVKNIKIKMYRIVILPVVLYGSETWSLTLREGRRCSRIGCWEKYLVLRGTNHFSGRPLHHGVSE